MRGMTKKTGAPAGSPKIARDDVAAVLATAGTALVLHLGTNVVLAHEDAVAAELTDDLLVLYTSGEIAAFAKDVSKVDFLGSLTRRMNVDLYERHAAGQIPSADEVAAALAELRQFEAESSASAAATEVLSLEVSA